MKLSTNISSPLILLYNNQAADEKKAAAATAKKEKQAEIKVRKNDCVWVGDEYIMIMMSYSFVSLL